MKMLLLSLLSLIAFNAMADSDYLDSKRLSQCGGRVQLRQAANGDLALKFSGNVNRDYCSKIRFVDVSSGRVIKGYEFEGTSYTLSNKMEKELGKDCAVEFQLTTRSGYVVESKQVVLKWWACWASHSQPSYPTYPSGRKTYEWSNKGNCKIMINGVYSGNNTPKSQEYLCRR
ncbi:MAG: hypothetical protein B7Y39_18740 [Bdellovibrio sp. 28-41-41]|nr:MAG: hypothetical protein B7Y39_18740 [Bdellovibrio sp. 28-41-41]